jgi:recombination protein RecT
MANQLQTTHVNPVVRLIKNEGIQKMIQERLQKRSGQFTTSLLSLVNANANIAACTPMTVIQAALTAASMDLPINQNLGFAYIVPYKNHGTMEAQFQMGWKGFVQLAQRSGKFKTINTTDVREGEVTERDRMTGELKFQWCDDDAERKELPVVGYLAYFELLNGFNKSLYMTKAEVESHAGRYSQSFKGGFNSPWKSDFDLMAQKTALKLLLSKFAPLSTEMQEAIAVDQSVDDGNGRKYIDNDTEMDDVKANDDEKADILAAHKDAEVVHEVKNTVEKTETVAEKAKRKYGPKISDDDKDS